ncbi:nucleotidyltransferase-like protein [Exiguobacterium flavidum]|uniref:nucleotidyltransferase-like protein n=1 Tax=Exiguobacterium flavidum TaxID=2184695 RepID=UPI000DF72F5F|nr:nucleotidyltransferase-like protein [Exiguobacterium flavidum]
MEQATRTIYSEYAAYPETLGIIAVGKRQPRDPLTDQFDTLLLIVTRDPSIEWTVKHYRIDAIRVSLHLVHEDVLSRWIVMNANRRALHWVAEGAIVFERNDYLFRLKQRLLNFPEDERCLQMGVSFAKLLRRFQDGRSLFARDSFYDSYTHVHHALHHLARLSVLEQGTHPEIVVWEQARIYDPEVYKLYEQLLLSEESLDQRIHLALIGVEHLLQSKVMSGGRYLFSVMRGKAGAWTMSELMDDSRLAELKVDLGSLMDFFVRKGMVRVDYRQTRGAGVELVTYEPVL